ncbi:unnamed protein product [Rhizoctonia solani]|uniref:Mitochondrial chaperone BCS1-B n=1 Tax=Rhizoctonia solani TaxID=456999 RepID=A0A8H3DD34_9AGAM|nr:unnamed protein product [Rhizoctonia solani]
MEMFSAVSSLVSPFVGGSSGGVMDGMKLVVLGGTVETARRVSSSAWNSFVNSFYLTARFSEDDYPYDWLMHWQVTAYLQLAPTNLSPGSASSQHGAAAASSRRQQGLSNVPGAMSSSFGDEFEDLEAEDDDAPGKQKMRVVFMPTLDTTHTIYYKGHWLRVCRSRQSNGDELLSISVVARSNNILKQLVLEAKKEYERDAEHRVQIFFADSVRRRRRRRSRQSSSPSQHGSWRWTDSRQKRPMSSIVLAPGVKEMLLSDTRDFLKSEKWYADRGIPFRRGYLLHGVPGSGKSSLIHAIAGELALDIYVVSLSSSWINDATLTALMGRVPARCIVLLEDLDAAFTRSTSRDQQSTGAPTAEKKDDGKDNNDSNNKDEKKQEDINTLSLSGLLNALDGVAASEGRILFATTNHLERLDPALSRPGRMDVWIEFKNATKWQCEQLFNNFFPAASADNIPPGPPPTIEEEKRAAGIPVEEHELDCQCRSKKDKDVERLPDGTLTPTLAPTKRLDAATLAQLAKKFSEAIPEEEFSVASLQGYLLKNKTRPQAAADEAAAWVISERELKARLQREKEEREAKERAEREKRRREREEKERREREEERERKRKEERDQARQDREADERERERKAKEEKERLEKEAKDKAEEEAKAASVKEPAVVEPIVLPSI